ncbi:hypothetical protein QVD99_004602 [Batrachochytrium dendrobatidis]|nr:hypothetical protein O5D80_002839 [Batrachochytrium dendrobatidis]KAK5668816.1 hypothetical protein QVD99_004602 [Batrachochytrium dendrobatidis]
MDSFGREDRRRGRRDRSPDDHYESKRIRRSLSPRNGSDHRSGYGGQDMLYDRDQRYRGHQQPQLDSRPDPSKLDYVVPYSHFAEFTRGVYNRTHGRGAPLTQEDLDLKYDEYKEAFARKHNDKLFKTHKDDEWFREKYHPVESLVFKADVYKRRAELQSRFAVMLSEGKFDLLCFDDLASTDLRATMGATDAKMVDATPNSPSKQEPSPSDMKTDDDATDTNGQVKIDASQMDTEKSMVDNAMEAKPVAQNTVMAENTLVDLIQDPSLFIKGISLSTKRSDIIEICQKVEGFKHLVLTDPRVDKKMSRLGWIVFDETVDLTQALATLDNTPVGEQTLHLAISQPLTRRQYTLPTEVSRPERLLIDLDQAKKLAALLDTECGLSVDTGSVSLEAYLDAKLGPFEAYTKTETLADEDAPAEDEADGVVVEETGKLQIESIKRRLDLYIEYMRQVHNFDYYSGVEAVAPEDFSRRCMVQLRRAYVASEDKTVEVSAGGPTTWAARRDGFITKLDQRVQIRLAPPTEGPLFTKMGGKPVEENVEAFLGTRISKESDSKFRCTLCSKLFKGDDFARKHFRGKHGSNVDEVIADLTYYNNFALDFNKLDTSRQGMNAAGMVGASLGAGTNSSGAGWSAGLTTNAGGNAGNWNSLYGGDRSGNADQERDRRGRNRREYSRGNAGMDFPRDEFGRRADYATDVGRHMGRRQDPRSRLLPPPTGRRMDPRQIRTYHDLDAPAGGDIELKYD